MNTHETYAQKVKSFQSRIGMFLIKQDYEMVVAFISGMDYCSGEKMLDGFNEWIRKTYKIRSEVYWGGLIEDVYKRECEATSDLSKSKGKVDFLFQVTLEFLLVKENSNVS